MKKFLVAVLALVMMLAIAVTASADETYVYFEIDNAPCEAIADNQLYRYKGDDKIQKLGSDHTVQVKHRVVQNNADETNRIAACDWYSNVTMGAHWHPSDYCYYPITSNAITGGNYYTAAARGNTNYSTNYGLNTIDIQGCINRYDE